MLKLISVGLIYDDFHKSFLLVREPEQRDWSFPMTGVQAQEHDAIALTRSVQQSTSVICQPANRLAVTSPTPGEIENDEWPRAYWLCIAYGETPKVVRGSAHPIVAAEYVDRATVTQRMNGRMPKPFSILLNSLA